MAGKERVPLTSGTAGATPQSAPAKDNDRAFKAGAVLLILANVLCGVFAGLAGKKVWNEDLDYAIAFTFLGLIFIGIFALAYVDSSTREDPGDWEYHH
jgi:hypothetical protein